MTDEQRKKKINAFFPSLQLNIRPKVYSRKRRHEKVEKPMATLKAALTLKMFI